MSFFDPPSRWQLFGNILDLSIAEMALDGARGAEGVAMWLGTYADDAAIVSHVAILRGPGVKRSRTQLLISAEVVNDLTDAAIASGLTLIGQIHSHGPLYGTDLSPTDKIYGIAVPGYLSVVAPDFAMRPNITLGQCGVHVFENGRGWRRLLPNEISKRVEILSDAHASLIMVES